MHSSMFRDAMVTRLTPQSVAEYFKRIGKHPREAPWMLLPYATSFGTYFVSYFVMFSPKINREYTTLPWIAALVHGWSHAILGLYPLHDATHASFTRSPLVWNFMRRFHDMLSGLNSHIWIHEHGMKTPFLHEPFQTRAFWLIFLQLWVTILSPT
jgi:hypothetical protein